MKTLIHIHVAISSPGSCVSSLAVTTERTRSVDAFTPVLARRPHSSAFVDVLLTCGSGVSRGARAHCLAGHLVSVAAGAHVARVPCALVLEMAEEASLARWTLTLVSSNLVMTGAAILTRTVDALVRVEFAVDSFEPIDTDALVATLGVLASTMVLARLRGGTLVNILAAILPSPVGRAVAGVGVHLVHTLASMLAKMASAVVPVHLAVSALEP